MSCTRHSSPGGVHRAGAVRHRDGLRPAPRAPVGPRLGRQVLGANDGWAAYGTGTTGGSAADAAHVYTVTDWAEFKAALAAGGAAPKIIKVKGVIDAVAEGCDAFAAPGYDFDAYLAKYAPETWGLDTDLSAEPDDSPEGLRRASAAAQDQAIKANVPANTTIVGVGRNAGFKGASLQIKGVDNVIVRNLTFESPIDCFPQWDPTDGDKGNWNSEYDTAVVYGSTHVWLDHNTFTDGPHPDSAARATSAALPAARRRTGHRPRRRPRHRLLERLHRARQDDPHRQQRQRVDRGRRPRPPKDDLPPQPVLRTSSSALPASASGRSTPTTTTSSPPAATPTASASARSPGSSPSTTRSRSRRGSARPRCSSGGTSRR